MADPLFIEEELDWWGDTSPTAVVTVPRPVRRRPPPRTLASDLRRLRAGFERRSPISPAAAGILALLLLAALAVFVRLSLGGEPAAEADAGPQAPAAEAEVAPAPPFQPTLLKPGDGGPRVRDLQVALTALGVFSGVDGDYGAATSAAVAAFQGSSGLTADGVAGPVTATAIRDALAGRAREDADTARAGIATAEEIGRLDAATAETARKAVSDAVAAAERQSPGRAAVLALVLRDVAAAAGGYATGHAPLFEELRANTAALDQKGPQVGAAVVADGAGVVYRHFPGQGYQFHPLASFAKLNALVRNRAPEKAATLAAALVARGVERGNTLVWEYRFPFGGSPDVWTSGFAQAVAAQALARAAELTGKQELTRAANAAFRAIPRDLTLPLAGGNWIQEYSFSDMAVLNAQLQSLIALQDFAGLTGNQAAGAYAAAMDSATRSVLDEVDTGCWSLYSLGGKPASDHYHAYHVTLLDKLGQTDPLYAETGRRWQGYVDAGGC